MLSVCIWSAAKGRASRFVIEVRDTRDVPEHADRARAAAARRENAEDVRPKWLSPIAVPIAVWGKASPKKCQKREC